MPCPQCGALIAPGKLLGQARAKTLTRAERALGGYVRHYGKRKKAVTTVVEER